MTSGNVLFSERVHVTVYTLIKPTQDCSESHMDLVKKCPMEIYLALQLDPVGKDQINKQTLSPAML